MATLLREIKAKIINLEYEVIPHNTTSQVMVKGNLVKEIFYVNKKGIVKQYDSELPFTVKLDTPDLTPDLTLIAQGEIEHISHRLSADGHQVEQQYIISITLFPKEKFITRSQHFLIRSVDQLDDSEHIKKITLPEDKAKANGQYKENEIIPIPNFTFLIEQKVHSLRQDMEETLRSEIKEKVHKDLENKLRIEIENKLYEELEDKIRREFGNNIENQLNKRFALLEKEKQLSELKEKHEQTIKWQELRRKSAQQKLYGYHIKG